jgi:hypothetical protein
MKRSTAGRLHDELINRPAFSDFHFVPRYDAAVDAVKSAGLGAILVPLGVRRSGRWTRIGLHLGVIDTDGTPEVDLRDPALRLYSLSRLAPITEYLGFLDTCSFDSPWWAVPSFFQDLSQVLAPWTENTQGGRSQWGSAKRRAFTESFCKRWGLHEELPIVPPVTLNPAQLMFNTVPLL